MPLLKIMDYRLALGNEKGSFTLRLEGRPWGPWVHISPAELAALGILLTNANTVFNTDANIFLAAPAAHMNLDKNEDEPPTLEQL